MNGPRRGSQPPLIAEKAITVVIVHCDGFVSSAAQETCCK
jgi:hypothetical protein